MNPTQDEQFTDFLRAKAREGKAAVGYPATQFHQMLNADGGFRTVKQLLAAQRLSSGFSELVLRGRTDLTVEALVVETEWRRHFHPQLLEIAEKRLRRTGYEFKRFEGPAGAAAPQEIIAPVVERPLPLASPDALAAAEWLKVAYGGGLTWESRKEGAQQGETPLRIYTVPEGAQVAIRMNKASPALYVRATSTAGVDVTEAIAAITPIERSYSGLEQYEAPSSLLVHAPYLKPAPTNTLLRLNPEPGQYKRIFELVLGPPRAAGAPGGAGPGENSSVAQRPIDEEEFRRRQERNAETGRQGELIALDWERARLANLVPPCPEPERYALRISSEDVGAGYDIISTWPDEERVIEVKTTTVAAPEFFMTENERLTLAAHGQRAWIYRVELGDAGAKVTVYHDPAPPSTAS